MTHPRCTRSWGAPCSAPSRVCTQVGCARTHTPRDTHRNTRTVTLEQLVYTHTRCAHTPVSTQQHTPATCTHRASPCDTAHTHSKTHSHAVHSHWCTHSPVHCTRAHTRSWGSPFWEYLIRSRARSSMGRASGCRSRVAGPHRWLHSLGTQSRTWRTCRAVLQPVLLPTSPVPREFCEHTAARAFRMVPSCLGQETPRH